MTQLNFSLGTIFHMDNLAALRGMNSSTIDPSPRTRHSTQAATEKPSAASIPTCGVGATTSTTSGWTRYATKTSRSSR